MATSASSAAAAAAKAVSSATFTPRAVFEASPHIIRSYFLGHHHAAVGRMQRVIGTVGLIIECRDFRVPLTAWNPILESALAAPDRERIIVYTKRDLGPAGKSTGRIIQELTRFHREERHAAEVLFLGEGDGGRSDKRLLETIKDVARRADSLTGLRALVVGMPNAGKSSLLNRLRSRGVGLGKAAKTGAQPGVTRKLGTPVRIVSDEEGDGLDGGVFVRDTPGVFVPHVADAESMLKLALVGCVKDGLVPGVMVADYLLFQLNRHNPALYERFAAPTNDVAEFLEGVARRTGKLVKGGEASLEGAADWIIQEWRRGALGRFLLDDVTPEGLQRAKTAVLNPPLTLNQARIQEKNMRRERSLARHQARQAEMEA